MPLRLARAEKQDVSELTAIYFTTFQSPIVLKLLPNVPSVRDWYVRGLENDMNQPYTHVYKVVDEERPEEIIAFARWTSPHDEPQEEQPVVWPGEGDPALFAEVVATTSQKKRELFGAAKYWYVAVLATLPRHQRRGAGSLLINEFCRQADQAGDLGYVEASPLGTSTYARFGFVTQDSFTTMIDGEPYVDCCMVRPRQKTSVDP